MATSNVTLTSLWVDDGQGSPCKIMATTPSKVIASSSGGGELRDNVLKIYKESGLENVAKEVGIIDGNGELLTARDQNIQPKPQSVQMIAIPVASPVKSPFKLADQQLYSNSSPLAPSSVVGTPQRIINAQLIPPASPRSGQQYVAMPIAMESPQAWSRKRSLDIDSDYSDGKRGKKGEKGGKGLRHFSMKVCEKVQKKGVTSYNEVADELVTEFSDPRTVSPTDQAYDQKNIRRRVYDALNVLMAMNIISKEKKEIRWIGLPTNSAQECQNLELEKQRRLERIKHKTQQLQELILQQIAFKNLVQRNRSLVQEQGTPAPNSAIQLPFIIVNTSKKTVIDCSISNDKYEYLFNFDNTFEIHDDIEVLKRMGMAFGLEKKQCLQEDLRKAMRMVPKALEPYVLELANVAGTASQSLNAQTILSSLSSPSIPQSPLAVPLATAIATDPSADAEVAMVTQHGLSRQSSLGSYSDLVPSHETPSEGYSGESESERSSPPIDMS